MGNIAIDSGVGFEKKNGLGWVFIGELTSSMLFTLSIVPIVYLTVDNLKEQVAGFRKKN